MYLNTPPPKTSFYFTKLNFVSFYLKKVSKILKYEQKKKIISKIEISKI